MGTQMSQMSQQENLKEICIFAFNKNKKAVQSKPNSPLDNRSGSGVGVFVLQANRFEQVGGTGARARDGGGEGLYPNSTSLNRSYCMGTSFSVNRQNDRQIHTTKNITFPKTTYAGGNNESHSLFTNLYQILLCFLLLRH